MALPVSVVLAARNEEAWIAASVTSAFDGGAAEVILADGDSSDTTRELAAAAGARVIPCPAMRARQFNEGARHARHDALLFLHGDTLLPRGAAAAVLDSLRRAAFGGFRIRFAEPSARLRFVAAMINLRTALTRCPWGDQAQFIRRDAFTGFAEIPLMEDYELAVRMKRSGPTELLPLTVTTSGRRFLRRGVIRTTVLNWTIIAAWRLGVAPETLAGWYRD